MMRPSNFLALRRRVFQCISLRCQSSQCTASRKKYPKQRIWLHLSLVDISTTSVGMSPRFAAIGRVPRPGRQCSQSEALCRLEEQRQASVQRLRQLVGTPNLEQLCAAIAEAEGLQVAEEEIAAAKKALAVEEQKQRALEESALSRGPPG